MTQPLALIIEDQDPLADIFAVSLKSVGYRTEIVSDGKTAMSRLAELIPTLIILDLHLPFVSGEKILHEIRNRKELANTQIIIATADSFLANQIHDASSVVLLKPISPVELRDIARRLIASPE